MTHRSHFKILYQTLSSFQMVDQFKFTFFADDLIILSGSKGLQNCLDTLSSFCNSWKLDINSKKTKVMIFQKWAQKNSNLEFNRKDLVKIRISNSKLMIDTGWYNQIPRNDTFYSVCNSRIIDWFSFTLSKVFNPMGKNLQSNPTKFCQF